MNMRFLTILLLIAGWPFAAEWPMSARAEPEAEKSLDEQLLEKLDADPLDELDRELFAPAARKPRADGPRDKKDGEELDRKLLRELGAAGTSEDEDPLLEIARQMRLSQERIDRSDSGAHTQQLQVGIVDELAKLIKQARRTCGQCKPSQGQPQKTAPGGQVKQPGKKPSGGGKKPGTKTPRDSNAKPGQAEARRPDMDRMEAMMKSLWGELPERARQQMLQLPMEEFLPKYELMIEEYFKRLSEENE